LVPQEKINEVWNAKNQRKVKKVVDDIVPILAAFTKAAKNEADAWLAAGGQKTIDKATKAGTLSAVVIPVCDFQKAGLMAAAQQMRGKMMKMGGKAAERAQAAVLTTRQHSTDLRREIDQMIQQLLVDAAKERVWPDLNKSVSKLKLPKEAKPVVKQVKRTVKGMAEELIRKESHVRLAEAWVKAEDALKIPECASKQEHGEAKMEDEFGFIMIEGEDPTGFAKFRGSKESLMPWFDPCVAVDGIMDKKLQKKILAPVAEISPLLTAFVDSAKASSDQWLADGGQQTIDAAAADANATLKVPVNTFIKNGLAAADNELRALIQKSTPKQYKEENGGKTSTLIQNLPFPSTDAHSTDLRRAFSQVAQQMVVDNALFTVGPEIDKKLSALSLPEEKGLQAQVRAEAYAVAEENLRKKVHSQIVESFKKAKAQLKIKGCKVESEPGNARDEDEFGFLVCEGGYEMYRARTAAADAGNEDTQSEPQPEPQPGGDETKKTKKKKKTGGKKNKQTDENASDIDLVRRVKGGGHQHQRRVCHNEMRQRHQQSL